MDKWQRLQERFEAYQEIAKFVTMCIGGLASLVAFIKSFMITETRDVAIPLGDKIGLHLPRLFEKSMSIAVTTHRINWMSLIFIITGLFFLYMLIKKKKKEKKRHG